MVCPPGYTHDRQGRRYPLPRREITLTRYLAAVKADGQNIPVIDTAQFDRDRIALRLDGHLLGYWNMRTGRFAPNSGAFGADRVLGTIDSWNLSEIVGGIRRALRDRAS